MSSTRTSSVPKEDVVFPRMHYCDSRCSQTLPGVSPALLGALLCNATRRLGDALRVILRERARGSVRAVRAVRNTRVFLTETRVVADELYLLIYFPTKPFTGVCLHNCNFNYLDFVDSFQCDQKLALWHSRAP